MKRFWAWAAIAFGMLYFILPLIGMIALYGAAANALYPIAVAHANDYASPEDFVKVSGADKFLVTCCLITVLFTREFTLLQLGVSRHALIFIT